DVRPVLSDACFACHGPDARTRKGGLRLDVPGKLPVEEIKARLAHADPRKRMPPQKTGKKLTASQIAAVGKWLDEGAVFAPHWAFVTPRRPAVPAGSHPIDAFIRERLKREGLAPSPRAEKHAQLRRLALDLTGLPPTPEEMDAFARDTRPDAWERAVDRLLSSPRHGEHLARYWLDAARFGDTHGLHLDNYREMWPYRDWVIRAFNENKPYPAFVTEQLAGDLLPGGKLADLVATGFSRAHITTSEGGSITEEIHIRNVNDRVDTLGTALLGLSVGCAKCHDHKYDPITQKDFYSLSAFFNSLEGNPLDGNARRHPPTVPVPTPDQERLLAAAKAKVDGARHALLSRAATVRYEEPKEGKRADRPWIDDALPEGKAEVGGANLAWDWVASPVKRGSKSVKVVAPGLAQVVFSGAKTPLEPVEGDALYAHVWLDPKSPPKEVMLQWHTAGWSHRAYWGANLIPWGADGTGERRRLGDLPAAGQWARLEVPLAEVGIKPGTPITGIAFTLHGGTAWFDDAGLVTGQGRSFKEWRATAKGAGLPKDEAGLRAHFIAHVWPEGRKLLAAQHAEIDKATKALATIEASLPVTYIYRETPTPRETFVLKRGEYDQRGEKVGRAVPAFLAGKKEARTRLDLAAWMLAPENPLTARVAVNRLWQQVFGVGLVKTSEDLGGQGEPPSHPELLDWLAVEFQRDWDARRMLRLMVTSEAYRQSAKVTKELAARDPENRLLARGPRHRLDAEVLRDQALAVSGLLAERIGGPSVKPPQPPGLWRAVAYVSSDTARFVADAGPEKVFRRGVYTFWKRTAPPPQMSAFDAPSRESCSVRRERTNTPLQALVLLNDPQHVEASRVLAQRALERGTDAERLAWLFKRATGRAATEDEGKELAGALADLRKEYADDPKAAAKLARVGETPAPAGIKAEELAAWTMLAS
ncbi:MAG: PSD1 and planctomycete cytochrome C domain-containing protein, partial [Gemmataceae bacterium]|nr:PSD1 and planctomycete cytochrome C domain-containing protein [Gemmataceae bacterium]